jgi:hypothetical protein
MAYGANTEEKADPLTELRSMRVELRHIENKGVGYNTGYSTLDLFFAPSPDLWRVMPFFNVRGHVFNDAKFATNVGVGFRTLAGCRVYGMNAYWDYRNTNRFHYNQVAIGFETLGVRWDFRLNGYLPVAAKTSHPYHNSSSVTFERFSGNNALVRTSRSGKQQFAMKGLDAEASFHILKNKNFDVYPAIGPYYYQYKNKHAIGGRIRLGAQITPYLTLEVIDTYDNRFHNNFQGSVSVNLPFGPKLKSTTNSRFKNCDDGTYVCRRMLQDVYRQEIIVVDKRKTSTSEVSVAINPATGQPYVFYFVDNTSNSAGTYESPFSALLDAQFAASPGDTIYVFPGDGTSNKMNQGITLSTNQSLLGASIAHPLTTTLGNVTIPPLATLLPFVTNTTGPVITLGGDNTLVSGFYIENGSNLAVGELAIQGILINNVTIQNNSIIGGNNEGGIDLQNIGGVVNINNNAFTQDTAAPGNAIKLMQSNASCNFIFSNNQVRTFGSTNGLKIDLINTGSVNTLQIIGNTFSGNLGVASDAINISMTDNSSINLLDIQNNSSAIFQNGLNVALNNSANIAQFKVTESNFGTNASGNTALSINLGGNSAIGTIEITDSILSDVSSYGALIQLNSTGSIEEISISNTTLNTSTNGLAIEVLSTGSIGDIRISNCTMNTHNSGAATYLTLAGSGSVTNYLVDRCTFNGNIGSQAIGLNLSNTGSIGNVSISRSNLNNNANGSAVIGATLNNAGSINNMTIDHCNAMYNGSAYAVFANLTGAAGGIENLTVSNSHLDYNINAGGVKVLSDGLGTVHHLTITDSSINYSNRSVDLAIANNSMDSLVISNANMDFCNLNCINANLNNSTIDSIEIDHLIGQTSFVPFNITGTNFIINNFNVSNVDLSGAAVHAFLSSGGVYGNIAIANSSFHNSNNSNGGISLNGPITSLSITDCEFESDAISISIFTDVENALIANNTFKTSKSANLIVAVSSGFSSYIVKNNTFSGSLFPDSGYGTAISVNGGSLCLDFQQNNAYPVQIGSFAPYSFVQSGGTFNLTSQSTQDNNVGTITTSGTVGAPGSCAQ